MGYTDQFYNYLGLLNNLIKVVDDAIEHQGQEEEEEEETDPNIIDVEIIKEETIDD